MHKLVVTGASGYVGGRLVAAAASAGFDVRSVVRSHPQWLQGSVVTIGSLEDDADRAIDGADAVVHLAGANEIASRLHPNEALASTVSASRAVAEGCARSGVARIVYVSTIHVYGEALAPGALIDEDTAPSPLAVYAMARLESEAVITARAGGTEVVVLRLTNGVGPPAHASVDRWSLVANDLCRQAACGGPLRLLTDGMQWRDFVALEDVDRILLAATDPAMLSPGTYNLGSGQPTRVVDLAKLVAETGAASGLCQAVVEAPPATGDAPAPYWVSIDRLMEAGYCPSTPLGKAVADTMSFCSEHRHVLCHEHPSPGSLPPADGSAKLPQ